MRTPHPAQPPAPAAGFAELPQVCRPCGCAALQELCCLCFAVLFPHEICFSWLWERPGSRGEVQTPPCVWGCRWFSREHGCHSSVVLLSDVWVLKRIQSFSSGGNFLPQWGKMKRQDFSQFFPRRHAKEYLV